MGSFANSLHVRSKDARAVAAAVERILRDVGYTTTDEEPDEEAIWSMASSPRAIQVSEPRDGWVALLDSDLMNMSDLGQELSRVMETYAIMFLVNDSDSWHYQLFYAGGAIDAFDSSGEYLDDDDEEDDDEDSSDLLSIFNGNGDDEDEDEFEVAGMNEWPDELKDRIQEMAQTIEDSMPPEIRALHDKINSGQADEQTARQYSDWLNAQMPQVMGEMQELLSHIPESAIPPHSEDELREHFAALRSLMRPGVKQKDVVSVLGKRAVFAEETLSEFLPLLGIAPSFADLSYAYVREYSANELQAADVRFAEHLKFRMNG